MWNGSCHTNKQRFCLFQGCPKYTLSITLERFCLLPFSRKQLQTDVIHSYFLQPKFSSKIPFDHHWTDRIQRRKCSTCGTTSTSVSWHFCLLAFLSLTACGGGDKGQSGHAMHHYFRTPPLAFSAIYSSLMSLEGEGIGTNPHSCPPRGCSLLL